MLLTKTEVHVCRVQYPVTGVESQHVCTAEETAQGSLSHAAILAPLPGAGIST